MLEIEHLSVVLNMWASTIGKRTSDSLWNWETAQQQNHIYEIATK